MTRRSQGWRGGWTIRNWLISREERRCRGSRPEGRDARRGGRCSNGRSGHRAAFKSRIPSRRCSAATRRLLQDAFHQAMHAPTRQRGAPVTTICERRRDAGRAAAFSAVPTRGDPPSVRNPEKPAQPQHLEVSGCVSVPRHKSESPILATLTFRSVTSRARCELIEEPCARERPVPLQRGDRDTKRFRGFALAQAGEIPELDHAAGPRVDRFET